MNKEEEEFCSKWSRDKEEEKFDLSLQGQERDEGVLQVQQDRPYRPQLLQQGQQGQEETVKKKKTRSPRLVLR